MFTSIISHIVLAISLVVSAPQPSQVEIVQLPENVQEQIMVLDKNDLDRNIELFEEMKSNSCTRSGCSLASHK